MLAVEVKIAKKSLAFNRCFLKIFTILQWSCSMDSCQYSVSMASVRLILSLFSKYRGLLNLFASLKSPLLIPDLELTSYKKPYVDGGKKESKSIIARANGSVHFFKIAANPLWVILEFPLKSSASNLSNFHSLNCMSAKY